jgi:hypothetical protein
MFKKIYVNIRITLTYGFLFIFAGVFSKKSDCMSVSRYLVLSVCGVFLCLTSCKNSKEYSVDSSFVEYLQRFENEGAARGHTFDPEANGLIIEFGNLANNDAGLTHYETPIRIQIDKTYWNAISKSAGADLMKEDLIFHELGHGLLNRDHLNTTLENGDWKSMMCGGDKVNNRSWNINYHGMRRKYYVDELFNESTPAPDFFSLQIPVDTTGFNSFVSFNFDSPSQAGWTLGDSLNYNISLDNGRLRFQSKVTDDYLVFVKLPTPLTIQTDFSYELTLNYPVGNVSYQYGIIFGPVPRASTVTTDSIEYFNINNNQNMYMGNRSWYSFFTELTETSIIPTANNKLKVFKIGQLLFYFINNVYCYSSEIVANDTLNEFGFIVPSQGVVWIDNFKISKRGSANISSQVKQNLKFEFGLQKTNPFNLNKVNNQ